MAISGTITAIDSRTVTTKYGPKFVYDIFVDGNKHSWGFKDPTKLGMSVGATIQFDTTADKYGTKITESTLRVLSSGSGAPPSKVAPAASSGAPSRYDQGFPVPVTSDKISILRQNALTNAVNTVGHFPTHFLASELTSNELVDAILDVARKFADYTSGQIDARAVEKIVGKMEE